MIRLMKFAFWFGLSLHFIALQEQGVSPLSSVPDRETITAARDAAGEIIRMCEREPDLCQSAVAAVADAGEAALGDVRFSSRFHGTAPGTATDEIGTLLLLEAGAGE